MLDQLLQIVFTPDPRALPSPLPNWRLPVGGGTIGALDLLIAADGHPECAALFGFLRFTQLAGRCARRRRTATRRGRWGWTPTR